MRSHPILALFLAFVVGLAGATFAIVARSSLTETVPLPSAMPMEVEVQYPDDLKSMLESGSRFPEEVLCTIRGKSRPIHDLFEQRCTVLLLWSPGCESCIEQAQLWDSVMKPCLRSDVIEIVCLPMLYEDSTRIVHDLARGKQIVFVDDERLRSNYHLIMMPTIIAVDNSGFIAAIQYGYSEYFVGGLIESATDFEVGPCLPVLKRKS